MWSLSPTLKSKRKSNPVQRIINSYFFFSFLFTAWKIQPHRAGGWVSEQVFVYWRCRWFLPRLLNTWSCYCRPAGGAVFPMNETSRGRDSKGDDDPQLPPRDPLVCSGGCVWRGGKRRWRWRQVRGTGGLRWGYLVRPVVPGRKAYLYRCILVLESLICISIFLWFVSESVPSVESRTCM